MARMNAGKSARGAAPTMTTRSMKWLRALRDEGSRDWMRQHHAEFQQHVQAPFLRIVVEASQRLEAAGLGLRGGPGTVFRIARDVRFSADKRPFHGHVEAVLSPAGTRRQTRAAIHMRCDLDGGFLRAGSFFQPPAAVRALRASIVAREGRFLEIVDELSLEQRRGARLAWVSDHALKRGPRGFEAHAEGPLAPFLRAQQPLIEQRLTQRAWTAGSIVDEILHFAVRVRPWLLFSAEALAALPSAAAAASPSKEIGR